MKYRQERAIVRTKWQWTILVLGIVFLFTLPLYAGDYWLVWLTNVAIVIVAVMGLHILTGLCGQVSIGQAAFTGVGAYATAVLTMRTGVNPWLCLPISALSAGIVGLGFGLPCFKLKGFYLAVSTMAASAIIVWFFQYYKGITGGSNGMTVDPLKLGGIDFGNPPTFFLLAAGIMVLATLFAKNIQRTSTGRSFIAIRDSELAAEVNGIPVFRQKMLAFFIGCTFAGVAGWLWAFSILRVTPDQFRMLDSMWYLGMLVIGGWGSAAGVFAGVIFLKLLELVLNDHITPALADAFPYYATQIRISTALIINGLVIIAFVMYERQGLIRLWARASHLFRKRGEECLGRMRRGTEGGESSRSTP
jgi:branched-chain amino acid transport system permease protein